MSALSIVPALEVPVEVLERIFGHLDGYTIRNVLLTCRMWRDTADTVQVWSKVADSFWDNLDGSQVTVSRLRAPITLESSSGKSYSLDGSGESLISSFGFVGPLRRSHGHRKPIKDAGEVLHQAIYQHTFHTVPVPISQPAATLSESSDDHQPRNTFKQSFDSTGTDRTATTSSVPTSLANSVASSSGPAIAPNDLNFLGDSISALSLRRPHLLIGAARAPSPNAHLPPADALPSRGIPLPQSQSWHGQLPSTLNSPSGVPEGTANAVSQLRHTVSSPVPRLGASREKKELGPVRELSLSDAPDEDVLRRWLPSEEEITYILKESHHVAVHDFKEYYRLIATCLIVDPSLAAPAPSPSADPMKIVTPMSPAESLEHKILLANQQLWTFGSPHRPLRRQRIFASLPEALRHADHGDFIYLHKGVYTDPLTITKNVRLCGQMRINDSIFLQAQFQTTVHWRAPPTLRLFHTDSPSPRIIGVLATIAEEKPKRGSLTTSSGSCNSSTSSGTSAPSSPRSLPLHLSAEPLIRGSISCIDFSSELTEGEPSLVLHPRASVDIHHSLFRNVRGTAVRICPHASIQLLRTSFSGNMLPLDISPQCTSIGLYKNIYKDAMNVDTVELVFDQVLRHARSVLSCDKNAPPSPEIQLFSESVLSFVDLLLIKETRERAVSMLAPLGVISQVLAVLNHSPKYIPLVQNMLAALNVFSKIDTARSSINSQDGLKLVHRILQHHESDLFIQSEGLSTIWHLATQEGLRTVVESVNLEEVIFSALSKFSQRTSLVQSALGALWNLSWLSNRLSDRIARHMDQLLALPKLHPANDHIQCNLFGVLWNMSTHPALALELAKRETVSIVAASLSRHPHNVKLYKTACSLLSSLLLLPNQRQLFVEANGVAILVEAMETFSSTSLDLFEALDSLFAVLWEGYACSAEFDVSNGVVKTIKSSFVYFGAQRSVMSSRGNSISNTHLPALVQSHEAHAAAPQDQEQARSATSNGNANLGQIGAQVTAALHRRSENSANAPKKQVGSNSSAATGKHATQIPQHKLPKPLYDMKLFSFCVQRKQDIHLLLSILNQACGLKSTRVHRLIQMEFNPDDEAFDQLQLLLKNSEPTYLYLFVATILKLILLKDPSRLFAVRGGAIDLLIFLTSTVIPKPSYSSASSALASFASLSISTTIGSGVSGSFSIPSSNASTPSPSLITTPNTDSPRGSPAIGRASLTNSAVVQRSESSSSSNGSTSGGSTPSTAPNSFKRNSSGSASEGSAPPDAVVANTSPTSSTNYLSVNSASPNSARRVLIQQQAQTASPGRNRLKTATRGSPPVPMGLTSSLNANVIGSAVSGGAAASSSNGSGQSTNNAGPVVPGSLLLSTANPSPTSLSSPIAQTPRLSHSEHLTIELVRMLFDCYAGLSGMFDTDSRSGRLNTTWYSELLAGLEHLLHAAQQLPFMSRRLLGWIRDRYASLLSLTELKVKQESTTFVPDFSSTANRRFIALKLSNSWVVESPAIPLLSEPLGAVFLDTRFKTRCILVQSDYATIWNPHGSMESIRTNHFFSRGQVYFEVELHRIECPTHRRVSESSRAPFIAGWCTARSVYYSSKIGAGNEPHSWAVNPLLRPSQLQHHFWASGDRLQCFLDIDRAQIRYGINGIWLPPSFTNFCRQFDASLDIGFASVITLYQGTQVRFLFGTDCQFAPPSTP